MKDSTLKTHGEKNMKDIVTSYEQAKAALYANVDEKYKAFNEPIVNCDYPTLGVRTPIIKKLAKSVPLSSRADVLDGFFADASSAKIYDAVLFAGCVAARKGDYAATREYLKKLIPMFGSWAHTDCVVPCLDWTDVKTVLEDFSYLLDCDGQYEKRFYIIYLMNYCLCDEYIDGALDTLAHRVKFGDYYVDMAAAWMIAEALVKQFDKAFPLIERAVFPKFVHNKAIQKAPQSYRIPQDVKERLKQLRIKN